MWRRIMVIGFPKIISEDEMDRELEMKLTHELSGIFNWAIEGYKRLKDRGFRFQEPESVIYNLRREIHWNDHSPFSETNF